MPRDIRAIIVLESHPELWEIQDGDTLLLPTHAHRDDSTEAHLASVTCVHASDGGVVINWFIERVDDDE